MHAPSPSVVARRILTGALLTGGLTATASVSARPGTHPIVVSSWDARASSVVLEYRHGSLDGGAFNVVSYHANFSATSGKLSAQFGMYYLNFSDGSSAPTAHGLAGSATAVFNLPVSRRLDNGLPLTAIDFYVGSAPTALISGERNYLTIPLVLGFGVPVTPVKAITITPWFEFSPSLNLDTVIHAYDFSNENPADYINPSSGEIELTASDVERVIGKSVQLDASAAVGARGGLDLALHVSDYFDVDFNASISSVGTAFSGTRVFYLGGGFIWRWDEIVPAVLPAEKRLLHEACDDIEQRFRSCPNAQGWRTPEQLRQLNGPAQLTPPKTAPPSSGPRNSPAPQPSVAPEARAETSTLPAYLAPSASSAPPTPAASSAPPTPAASSAPPVSPSSPALPASGTATTDETRAFPLQ